MTGLEWRFLPKLSSSCPQKMSLMSACKQVDGLSGSFCCGPPCRGFWERPWGNSWERPWRSWPSSVKLVNILGLLFSRRRNCCMNWTRLQLPFSLRTLVLLLSTQKAPLLPPTKSMKWKWHSWIIRRWQQRCGSGIRCLLDPWIWDPGWVKIRIRDEQHGSYFRELFWV